MLTTLAIWYLFFVSLLSPLSRYIERKQWWTLRLRLSCLLPRRTLAACAAAAFLHLLHRCIEQHPFLTQLLLATGLLTFSLTTLVYLVPFTGSGDYVRVRWKAWSGPSRTGIPAHLTRYLGDSQDWRSLDTLTSSNVFIHPVEVFLGFLMPWDSGIRADPTSLLNARSIADEEGNTVWLPRSDIKMGAYAPSASDESISLLWSKQLGFASRCSRGIIAVPIRYLSHSPQLPNGLDARAICLAHGILARNKGPQPHQLVCNLKTKNSFRLFEENGVMWPRPAKTLRSFYHKEFMKSFSGLGSSYVTAATELALLIADTPLATLADWLDNTMEQQDLNLNHEIAALNGTADHLSRLYRGQYATMLVSLSLHRPGIHIRPELSVFEAMCQSEGVDIMPAWLGNEPMQARKREEERFLGSRGINLVDSMI